MKTTVFAWNSRRMLVEVVHGAGAHADEVIDAVFRVCRKLHRRRSDPRWQIVAGEIRVQVRGRRRKAVRK